MWTNELDKHASIGLDIDETLIDGAGSEALKEWCRNNFSKKKLHVITFRHSEFLDKARHDLEINGYKVHWFASIQGINPDISMKFNELRGPRGAPVKKFLMPDDPTVQLYRTWKAKRCWELNATALVDDQAENVKLGCDLYGIKLIIPPTF